MSLFAWGAEEVLTGASWSVVSGAVPTLAGAVKNPFGLLLNVYAVSNTAASQSRLDRVVTVPAAARLIVPVFVRGNGSTTAAVQVSSGGTSAALRLNIDGAGVVTTQLDSSTGGASVSGVAINVGQGGNSAPAWWLVLAEFTGLAAGSGLLRLYPNLVGFASAASTYFYVRPVWTHGYLLDQALDLPLPRAGSETRRSTAGVEDAWDAGTDEALTGVLRYVPPGLLLDPPCSGWSGDGTDLVGLGLRALLRQGRLRKTIYYVRDRSDCTQFTACDLVEPYDAPQNALEDDGTYRVPIKLLGTTAFRGAL